LGLLRVSADREMPAPTWPWFQVDCVGGVSKCGDCRVRTLLYEAANVMLTRYKGQLKLRTAFAIAWGLTMGRTRVALTRCLAFIMHAMPRDGTEFVCRLRPNKPRDRRPHAAPRGAPPWGGNNDGAVSVACARDWLTAINPAARHPAYPMRARRERRLSDSGRWMRAMSGHSGTGAAKKQRIRSTTFVTNFGLLREGTPCEIGHGRRYHLTSSERWTSRVSVRCQFRCTRSEPTALLAHRRINRRQRQRA
jgi:hypothetical protein